MAGSWTEKYLPWQEMAGSWLLPLLKVSFLKRNDGPWEVLEAPGIRDFGSITCLGVNEEEIAVGTDGEGLHLFSGSTWEVRTSRYGGLADDGVLSLAYDGEDEGLDGSILWVGTRTGIAARRDGEWKVYSPEGEWLMALTGKSGVGAGKVYIGTGFKLGKKGDDTRVFRPPVYAISTGPDRLVLGNKNARVAVVTPEAVSVLVFRTAYGITRLIIKDQVLWAGTDRGLLWGGLKGFAEGEPWPPTRGHLSWSGTLFGSRNSQPFEYAWKFFGYNSAEVVGLLDRDLDLWVAHGTDKEKKALEYEKKDELTTTEGRSERSAVRLYVNVDEFIARKAKSQFETYGLSAGIKGKPTALYVSPDSSTVWVGTTSGLWELRK